MFIGLARPAAVANGMLMLGIGLPLMVLRKVLMCGILALEFEAGAVASISGWLTTLGLTVASPPATTVT